MREEEAPDERQKTSSNGVSIFKTGIKAKGEWAEKETRVPGIIMKNITSSRNGGDGIRIDGEQDISMENILSEENGGEGINIIKSPKPPEKDEQR